MFDSHAHYDDKRFDKDRAETLQRAFDSGVEGIINIGCSVDTSIASITLAEKYNNIWATVGIHPSDTPRAEKDAIEKIRELCKHEKVVAIGEIGLDYHWNPPRDVQKDFFIKQMELAEELKMPVSIHCREAIGDCLEIILNFKNVKGVFHCYPGSGETAKVLQKAGYYISFAGVCTYDNAPNVRAAMEAVSLDRILVETDCPYLAPQPFRRERNESAYMKYTLETVAKVKGISFEEAEKYTTENTKRLFGIS